MTELQNINNLSSLDTYYIGSIELPYLKEFVTDAIQSYGDIHDLYESNVVCSVIEDMLKRKGLWQENSRQSYIDVMIAA